MVLKFNLTANEQHKDGFKLSVLAETFEEVQIGKELSLALIEKIKKIEVCVKNYDNE